MNIEEIKAKYLGDSAKPGGKMYKSTKNGRIVTEAEAMKVSDRQKKFMNKKVLTKEDWQKMLDFEFFIPVDQMA